MIDPRQDMLLLCHKCNEFRTFRWDTSTSTGVCVVCGRDNLDGGSGVTVRAPAGDWSVERAVGLLAEARAAARRGVDVPPVVRHWAVMVDQAAQRGEAVIEYDHDAVRAVGEMLRGAA